jgi:CDP-diacylglycerol---glycerol-3-phosphate 3-phosphatidyltransferase
VSGPEEPEEPSPDPGGHVNLVEDEEDQEDDEVVRLADLRAPEPGIWNLPNAITFLRALLVPVIFLLLLADTQTAQWWAFGIFVFAALTDTVDGWVARRWHGVTRWGQFADPIADKILVIGTLAAIAALGTLPWWAVIVIAVREVAITVLRVRIIFDLDVVVPASGWGKSKTLSQLVAVAAYLLPGVDPGLRLFLLYIAVVLTVFSGVDYAFKAGRRIRHEHSA